MTFARIGIAAAMLALAIHPARAGLPEDCEGFNDNVEKSIKACTTLIARNPKDARAYINRAFAYAYGRNDLAKGVADMDKAAAVSPLTNKDDYEVLDSALCGIGKFLDSKKCAALCNRRIAIAPKDPRPYASRAMTQPTVPLRLADLEQAIRLDPTTPGYYITRAFIYEFALNDVDRALKDYETAISLKPEPVYLPTFYSSVARLNIAKGDYVEAVVAATKAIDVSEGLSPEWRMDSNTADAYRIRAEAYLKLGKADKALADANKALSLVADDNDALLARGLAYEALGQRDKAIADLRSVLKHGADDDAKAALVRLGVAP